MSVEIRAYDNEHGDPVVVMVTTGSYDVSRLVGLMVERGRCEDRDRAHLLLRAVRRHNGGRLALKLLRDHGGTDFTEPDAPTDGCCPTCGALPGHQHPPTGQRWQHAHEPVSS